MTWLIDYYRTDESLVPLLVVQSHRDSVRLATGIQVEIAETRAPGDTSKKDEEEESVGEGIIKLSNIKIQYHKK